QAVIGFSDAAMVAPLGEDALAATTAGSLNTMAIFILPMGIVFIVQSFAAQLAGRRDLASARRYAWYALILAAITLTLGAAAIPAVGGLVDRLGFSPEVRALMATYIGVRFLAAGAVVGGEGIGNWYAGLGDTRIAMATNVVAMAVNVFLNWVLIYGNLGAPALGVEGAAWASVLASWAGFGAAAAYFGVDRGRRVMARLEAEPPPPASEPEIPELAELPPSPADARLTLAWQGMVGLIYVAFPGPVMTLFASDREQASTDEVAVVGATLLAISAAWQLFDALVNTLGEALRAAGDTAWCLWARVATAWLVWLPTTYLVVEIQRLGAPAALWCMVGYFVALTFVLGWRFRSGAWRSIDLTGRGHEPPI
ncbi:MAG: polysaccharide biosynthesis C-terminal domain-containing protein, partial [Myxococcales bacterium]|nr:polysaccharide biosynthesis C-terminal domain-containing protein [Myxococcales bacterium]